jgi:hypothetical protein
MRNAAALTVILLSVLAAAAQADAKTDALRALDFFAGRWTGKGNGVPGSSDTVREYRFTLGGRFLEVSNRAVYAPQEKNPKGETHEDRGFFSYDHYRKAFVFRQFHGEGFVNQYVLVSLSEDRKRWVFESESIENIGAGWRARETYEITGPDSFTETFELAGPNGDFAVYSKTDFRRDNPRTQSKST